MAAAEASSGKWASEGVTCGRSLGRGEGGGPQELPGNCLSQGQFLDNEEVWTSWEAVASLGPWTALSTATSISKGICQVALCQPVANGGVRRRPRASGASHLFLKSLRGWGGDGQEHQGSCQ